MPMKKGNGITLMYMQDDVLTEPFELRGCHVIPSKKPGLGIDRAKLKHYELI